MSGDEGVVRIERGAPTPEELAALTAVLLARMAGGPGGPGGAGARRTAGWRRPADVPVGWRSGAAGRPHFALL
ncbi:MULTISPECIES: acyl-CoA carboxylase epsilon subunit [unclassified Streptomyces]|uniref:acyl-CoA carboxylase epsilon subunit n=1 Tax=unclassified Streptomyces TaxID=2593676 RepID=UPI002F9165BD